MRMKEIFFILLNRHRVGEDVMIVKSDMNVVFDKLNELCISVYILIDTIIDSNFIYSVCFLTEPLIQFVITYVCLTLIL